MLVPLGLRLRFSIWSALVGALIERSEMLSYPRVPPLGSTPGLFQFFSLSHLCSDLAVSICRVGWQPKLVHCAAGEAEAREVRS